LTRRALGLIVGLGLLMSGCSSSSSPVQFAPDQVLRLVAPRDVLTLDPAKIHQPSVELNLARNVFGGLYRFRDDLVEEPDLAADMPTVSPDGLTWTFQLRSGTHFSNGDPVKASDVLYSWNRVASLTDYDSSFIFSVVAGYTDVYAKRTKTLSGLTAPNDHTVVAKLTAPAGYWIVELGLWAAAVIDKNVVDARGEDTWWTTPDGLVGTGPFRMTNRIEGRSLDFEPVANWWAGSTGRLKSVHVEVTTDQALQVSRYLAGDYDIVGYTPADAFREVSAETISRFRNDSKLSSEIHFRPYLRTFDLGVRGEGRIGTAADTAARQALSQALDRRKLADICLDGASCTPATGGIIIKGLAGYLGDGADPNAKHDVAAAQALLRTWDPNGTRRKVLRMGAYVAMRSLAEEVKAEWHSALGIDVQLEIGEGQTIQLNASRGLYDIVLNGFRVDYDSPHNWFTGLDTACHATVVNPQFQDLVAAADKKRPADALVDYRSAGQLMANDAACPALAYEESVQLIKPWVVGAGGNPLYENYWTSISILKH
jgi:oligopeptide transport system substrate-binding protein